MITSGTRAQVLDLIAKHDRQDSVIMVATDGVFSTEHFEVPGKIRLGGWERTDYLGGMTLARPGIYWTADGKLRARGMGRQALESAQTILIDALDRNLDKVTLAPRTVFGGSRLCVYKTRSGDILRSDRYATWHDIPTRLSLSPAPKRTADWSAPTPLEHVHSAPFGASQIPENPALLAILEQLQELAL